MKYSKTFFTKAIIIIINTYKLRPDLRISHPYISYQLQRKIQDRRHKDLYLFKVMCRLDSQSQY